MGCVKGMERLVGGKASVYFLVGWVFLSWRILLKGVGHYYSMIHLSFPSKNFGTKAASGSIFNQSGRWDGYKYLSVS